MSVSDRVILRRGPLHRRVYDRAELLKAPPAGYRETDEYRALGTIFHGLGQAKAAEPVRIWVWDAEEPIPAPPAARTLCTFRGCGVRATFRISGESGGDWLGCGVHAPAMAKSFEVGQRIDYTVTLRPIVLTRW